jgi:hypothetical protein
MIPEWEKMLYPKVVGSYADNLKMLFNDFGEKIIAGLLIFNKQLSFALSRDIA